MLAQNCKKLFHCQSQRCSQIQSSGLYLALSFLPDPGVRVPGLRSMTMGPGVCLYLTPRPTWNFADTTLADDDTNSIITDDAIRAIGG